MKLLALTLLIGCGSPQTGLTNGPKDVDIVTGTGKMSVDREELVIADIQVDYSRSESFVISSIGDGNLQIYEIRIVADVSDVFFSEEIEDLELAPTQTYSYTVVADLAAPEPADGELRIRTSDPDAPNFILPLHAWPEGYVPPEDTGADSGGADSGGA
ncbi:MAG: hypothetical protein Q8P41_19745 [Pseudomonadota bacterium]|nr:hypothetical protein [Pseudomonadota bacterium]